MYASYYYIIIVWVQQRTRLYCTLQDTKRRHLCRHPLNKIKPLLCCCYRNHVFLLYKMHSYIRSTIIIQRVLQLEE